MPHCQKEKHDHTAKSKKERLAKKEELLARRKAAKDLEAELEAAKIKPTNIGLADGFGDYEVGCEPEKELKAPRFNVNKRSKKVSDYVTRTVTLYDTISDGMRLIRAADAPCSMVYMLDVHWACCFCYHSCGMTHVYTRTLTLIHASSVYIASSDRHSQKGRKERTRGAGTIEERKGGTISTTTGETETRVRRQS
jgi:hypothetical protein